MKTLYVILIVASVAFTQSLPSLLNANGTLETYSAKLNTRFAPWGGYSPNFIARKEFIVTFIGYNVGVLRRNSTGGYDLVSKWAFPVRLDPSISPQLSANDEWIALTNYVYRVTGDGMNLFLFKVANNGTITSMQTPAIPANVTFEASCFHSDGLLIGLSRWASVNPAKSAAFHRFQLVNGNWTLTNSFQISERLQTYTLSFQSHKYQTPVFQLSGNYLVLPDLSSTLFVYELSTNATSWTWSIKDSVPMGVRAALAWNGEDTFVASQGSVVLATRLANGTWSRYAVNLPPGGDPGYAIIAVNKDTFLVSVSQGKGFLVMLQRLGNTWYLGGIFETVMDQFWAGVTLALTDQHVLIDGKEYIHAIPLCVFRPIDYDCASIVELELCDFVDFTAEIACTPKPAMPECTFPVTTIVTRQYIANNTFYINYEMRRFGATSRQETVGIRCGLSSAPSTSPNVGTPASSSPSASAPASSVPITAGSPSAAPKNSDDITSDGNVNCVHQIVVTLMFMIVFFTC